MARQKPVSKNVTSERQFILTFYSLCKGLEPWSVWEDFITMASCAIANASDPHGKEHNAREKEYAARLEHLGGEKVREKVAQLFACVVNALDENQEQDFLGRLFMRLNLANHWKGQFFTPYNVCDLMAELTLGESASEEVQRKGWTSVCDEACGAGATLIAAANCAKRKGIDYQSHILFVAQDIDRTAALMCYIQLSLLDCAGYVTVADTIKSPVLGINPLFPAQKEGREIWCTPMFYSDVWNLRRLYTKIELLTKYQVSTESANVTQCA